MTGEIGTISLNGEQVGGFKYWTALQNKDTGQSRVIASKYQLLKQVSSGEFNFKFYSRVNDELSLVYSVKGTIQFPDLTVNKTIDKNIEIDLGVFNWVEK